MRNKNAITLFLTVFLFVACSQEEIGIVPGTLYRVTTTDGDGFARFERMSNNRLSGILYLDEGQLMAVKRSVSLKGGKELALVDSTGRKIPIINFSPYEEPLFMDYPETWAYRDSAYVSSVVEDVVYGSAQGYWISYPDTGGTNKEIFDAKQQELELGKKELGLTMDVYLPKDSSTASRPLLVLIHGGAFFNGDKADLGFPELAHFFASVGYVVASVNYRLGFRKNLASVNRAGFRAVQDVDAAIRYIIHNKDIYKVDPDRVFLAGTSAGGITALNVAFMRDDDIPSDAKEEGGIKFVNSEMRESYTIRAVGNFWGAVNELAILDNANSSIISFHNIEDPVVPFDKGHPFKSVFLNWLIFPTMYGSGQITNYLGSQRATLKCYDLPARHTLHVDRDENGTIVLNSRFFEMETAMCDFFSERMLTSPVVIEHVDRAQTFQIQSPDIDSVYWRVEGGVITPKTNNRIDVLLFPDADSHSVTVSGKYKMGLTFRHKWNL